MSARRLTAKSTTSDPIEGAPDEALRMTRVVYDAGALIAAERNDRRMWLEHRVRLELGIVPAVPSPVVAQVSRSSKQVRLSPAARWLRSRRPARARCARSWQAPRRVENE
jgi:hypothetical protein